MHESSRKLAVPKVYVPASGGLVVAEGASKTEVGTGTTTAPTECGECGSGKAKAGDGSDVVAI